MRKNQGIRETDPRKMAEAFLEGAGGRSNIVSWYNCITRLRLELKNPAAVDEDKIKSSGAAAVFWPGENLLHIVIGPQVFQVAGELKKLLEAQKMV